MRRPPHLFVYEQKDMNLELHDDDADGCGTRGNLMEFEECIQNSMTLKFAGPLALGTVARTPRERDGGCRRGYWSRRRRST